MSIELKAQEAVAKGADLFDRTDPFWFLVMETAGMSVHESENCPVVQVVNEDFCAGIEDLFGDDWAGKLTDHGFSCPKHLDALYVEAWEQEVEKRSRVFPEDTPDRMAVASMAG